MHERNAFRGSGYSQTQPHLTNALEGARAARAPLAPAAEAGHLAGPMLFETAPRRAFGRRGCGGSSPVHHSCRAAFSECRSVSRRRLRRAPGGRPAGSRIAGDPATALGVTSLGYGCENRRMKMREGSTAHSRSRERARPSPRPVGPTSHADSGSSCTIPWRAPGSRIRASRPASDGDHPPTSRGRRAESDTCHRSLRCWRGPVPGISRIAPDP
jgi:hypothetical protein